MPRSLRPSAAVARAAAGLCAAVLASGPAWAHEIASTADCVPAGAGPVYDCTFALTDAGSGAPVPDAAFTVHAGMPSMPMAHNVRPVAAEPTDTPGVYAARLALEMYGTWRLELRLTAPHALVLDHRIDFVE